jgi:Secretion system C-terminal sorting domain
MKSNLTKLVSLLLLCTIIGFKGFCQSISTLEMDANEIPVTATFGSSLQPMTSILKNDVINSGVFITNSPEINVTVSFRNQQFTGLNYGSTTAVSNGSGGFYSNLQTTGLVFGVGPLTAQDGGITAAGGLPLNSYDFMGAYYVGGSGGPKDNMFTTNPKASGAQLATGMNVLAGGISDGNGAFQMFTTAQALFGSANGIGSRVYFGDIVFTFNLPVINPVLHFSGLGGAYRYCPPTGNINNAADYLSTFFSTELELVNTGLASTRMSGNPYFDVSGNNILNTNNANPNGGSFDAGLEGGLFNNYGAATGSVKLTGTVKEVVYRVYLQGGTSSQFPWSVVRSAVINNNRDPFTGDIWYAAVSLDKPTQQISGNIFIDRDGLTNNNINTSVGVDNPKTNLGGSLFANLLNTAGQVVASIPVSNDGVYLFDNVPVGTYSVQLTTNASSGTYSSPVAAPATVLPTGWANTGEFVGNTVGSDGTVNGASSSVVVGSEDIKVEVNFGIERLPESVSYETFINKPTLNTFLQLDGGIFNMPVLSGSDPEDQQVPGPLTNKALRIDTLPNNASLYYAGNLVSLGQVIPNYTPSLLEVKFTNPGAGITGIVKFNYSYIDAAGLADPTPATYTIRWPAGGPLPIVLLEFAGIKNNCNASLNWKTASELDSDKFEVEFSTTTNTTFETVGTIGASGNSTTTKSYQFNYGMESGVGYYFRLKMYKKDGTFTYSQIIALSCIDTKASIAIVPNPTNTGAFQIRGMAKGKNTVSIYSNDGKLIRTENVINNKDVNISNLAAGTYVIRILNENGTASVERLVKY